MRTGDGAERVLCATGRRRGRSGRMPISSRWVVLLVVTISSLGACSAGSDGGSSTEKPFYTLTCAQDYCESCLENASEACDDCNSLCSNSSTSGCFSTCSRICGDTCPKACSGTSLCKEWKAELTPLDRDEERYDSCLAYERACSPDKYNSSLWDYIGRVGRREGTAKFAAALTCRLEHQCENADECNGSSSSTQATTGTLGDKMCARRSQCGDDCRDGDEKFLNGLELSARHEVVEGVRHCIAEEACGSFKACDKAYDGFFRSSHAEPKDPAATVAALAAVDWHGDARRCREAFYSSCGVCDCGFVCQKSCPTCNAFCLMPCTSDSQCVGLDETLGLEGTPVCT